MLSNRFENALCVHIAELTMATIQDDALCHSCIYIYNVLYVRRCKKKQKLKYQNYIFLIFLVKFTFNYHNQIFKESIIFSNFQISIILLNYIFL